MLRLLGPTRSSRISRPSTFYQSVISNAPSSDESVIISTLSDISNKLCHIHESIATLDDKVDDLSKRVASIEEAAEPLPKKQKVQIPPELSVS